MADRTLPRKRNPHLGAVPGPEMQLLVQRRRLGQTELTVDPGQIGTSNATKQSNLGVFDYAHLRVPLPKDLKGSGIFVAGRNQNTPEAYFLMRRSTDGYISATGMFKVAFPWASVAEEDAEKKHIKSFPEAGQEEIAGNVWIPVEKALELADEYDIRDWVLALIDPAPMDKGTHDPDKIIQHPPIYQMPEGTNGISLPPPEKMSTRGRNLRSASPSKIPTTPSKKIATPKRTKRGRPAASSNLATTAEETASPSAEPEGINGGHGANDTVTVTVDSTTEAGAKGGETTTKTHVTIETPANHPELSLPDDAEAFLEQAKAAIQEANKLTAGRAAGRKRKAAEITRDEEEDELANGSTSPGDLEMELQPAKRVRFTEQELRKEKIKRRATYGIAASLAIGAMLPVVMGTFFQAL